MCPGPSRRVQIGLWFILTPLCPGAPPLCPRDREAAAPKWREATAGAPSQILGSSLQEPVKALIGTRCNANYSRP